MATAIYRRGNIEVATYTAVSDISAGDIVVLGAVDEKRCRVGVARSNIASGDAGLVAITGVFEFPKVSGAVIKAGESVNWDASAGAVDDNAAMAAAGDVDEFGCAMIDAGNGVTEIDIEISHPGVYEVGS